MPSKPNGGPALTASPGAALALMSELSRRQVAAVVESGCALFRGFEKMRAIQQRTAHAALAEYEDAAGRLGKPVAMADLVALEAELTSFDLQGAAIYWQQLGAAALEMQQELVRALTAAETTALQDVAAKLQDVSSAMPGVTPISTRAAGSQRAQH